MAEGKIEGVAASRYKNDYVESNHYDIQLENYQPIRLTIGRSTKDENGGNYITVEVSKEDTSLHNTIKDILVTIALDHDITDYSSQNYPDTPRVKTFNLEIKTDDNSGRSKCEDCLRTLLEELAQHGLSTHQAQYIWEREETASYFGKKDKGLNL